MKLQVEAKQVIVTIHLFHVEVKQVLDATVVDVSEHLSSEILERIAKVKEDI